MLNEITISRILLSWLCILLTLIISMSYNDETVHTNIGPSDKLIIFGSQINTNIKYAFVVVLCVFNSAIRVLNTNIIHAWVINNIQDTKIYYKVNTRHAYEITSIHAVYSFVDWYFYMNIILSQIDLFMIELVVDLIMAILTTRYYLNIKAQQNHPKIQSADVKNYILASQLDFDQPEVDVIRPDIIDV